MAARKKPLDHLRSRKKPIYFDFSIPDDGSYQDRVNELAGQVAQAQLRLRGRSGVEAEIELDELKSELERATEELAPHLLWFRARSLPPKEYDELVTKHPPTEDQRKEAKRLGVQALAYNYETFLEDLATKCIYYLYAEDEDGELVAVTPPLRDDKREKEGLPPVKEQLVTEDFLREMKEEGNWAAGEISTICQAASNVNQGLRRLTELGNV